jgi:hypothetical protein
VRIGLEPGGMLMAGSLHGSYTDVDEGGARA